MKIITVGDRADYINHGYLLVENDEVSAKEIQSRIEDLYYESASEYNQMTMEDIIGTFPKDWKCQYIEGYNKVVTNF